MKKKPIAIADSSMSVVVPSGLGPDEFKPRNNQNARRLASVSVNGLVIPDALLPVPPRAQIPSSSVQTPPSNADAFLALQRASYAVPSNSVIGPRQEATPVSIVQVSSQYGSRPAQAPNHQQQTTSTNANAFLAVMTGSVPALGETKSMAAVPVQSFLDPKKLPVTPQAKLTPVVIEMPGKLTMAKLGIELSSKNDVQVPVAPKKRDEKESAPIDPSTVIILPPVSDLDRLSDAEYQRLLDATNVKPRSQILRETFEKIATSYMKDMQFLVGGIPCQIVEMEFFYYPDPYLNLDSSFPKGFDDHLMTMKHFYVHRKYHRKTGKITFSRKEKRGLYITMGSVNEPGAILIRSLRRLDVPVVETSKIKSPSFLEVSNVKRRSDIIEGPNMVMDFILQTLQTTVDGLASYFRETSRSKGLLCETLPIDDIANDPGAKLRFVALPPSAQPLKLYSGPRIGLNLSNRQANPNLLYLYIEQPFRYVSMPADVEDGKSTLAIQAQIDLVPDDSIKSIFELSGDVLGRWKGTFLKGRMMSLDRFIGKDKSNFKESQTQLAAFGFFSQFTTF